MTLASAILAHCDAVRSVSSGIRRRTTAFSAHIRHRVYALSCEERAFLGRAAAAAEELLRCNDAALEVAACEAEKAYALFQDDAKTEEASVSRVGHKAIEWDRYLHNIEEDPGEGCKVVTGGFRCNATGCFAAAVSGAAFCAIHGEMHAWVADTVRSERFKSRCLSDERLEWRGMCAHRHGWMKRSNEMLDALCDGQILPSAATHADHMRFRALDSGLTLFF